MCRSVAKISLSILLVLMSFTSIAQTLTITRLEESVSDITARLQQEKDFNGRYCGLLKILCLDEITRIEGNVIKDVDKGNEHWVYLSPGTKRIKVSTRHHSPLDIYLPDHMAHSIEPQVTYTLELTSDLPMEILYGISDPMAPVALSKDTKALLPPWWNTPGQNQYVGISCPTFDGRSAKAMAITNAVAQFAYGNGGKVKYLAVTDRSEVSIDYENPGEHESTDKNLQSYDLLMDGFSISVLQEYYNSLGEYFVLCEINKEESSLNKFHSSWEYYNDDEEGHISNNMSIEIRNDRYTCCDSLLYLCLWNENSVSFGTDINKKNIYKWETDLNIAKEDLSDMRLYGNLGLSQIRLMSALPCMTDSVKIRARSMSDRYWNEVDDYEDYESYYLASEITGSGICCPRFFKIMEYNHIDSICKFSVKENIPDVNFSLPDWSSVQSNKIGLSKKYFPTHNNARKNTMGFAGYSYDLPFLFEKNKNISYLNASIMGIFNSPSPEIQKYDRSPEIQEYNRVVRDYILDRSIETEFETKIYPLWFMDTSERIKNSKDVKDDCSEGLANQVTVLFETP